MHPGPACVPRGGTSQCAHFQLLGGSDVGSGGVPPKDGRIRENRMHESAPRPCASVLFAGGESLSLLCSVPKCSGRSHKRRLREAESNLFGRSCSYQPELNTQEMDRPGRGGRGSLSGEWPQRDKTWPRGKEVEGSCAPGLDQAVLRHAPEPAGRRSGPWASLPGYPTPVPRPGFTLCVRKHLDPPE